VKTIRQWREARGLSPVEMAAELGVSLATIYNWETGKSEPRASMLRRIALLLQVKMEDIDILEAETPKASA
jgi:transcriptional regulator with XRE-family HTH domain